MPANVLQKRSLYPQVIPPVEPFSVYPLEMIRPRYMPAADMRTVLNQYHHRPSYAEILPNISVSKSSFIRHTPTRLSTPKRPKTFAVRTVGIQVHRPGYNRGDGEVMNPSARWRYRHLFPSTVPENVYTPDYAERLLPRAARIKTDTIPNGGPYMFLARKRKLIKPLDNGIFYSFEQTTDFETPRDICSVTGRPYSRKKWLTGPKDNLIVTAFNGGAAEPTPNERRYLQLMRGTTLVT